MGDQYDAPNQQVVRPDGSGPWDEGSGGSAPEGEPEPQQQQAEEAQPTEQSQQAESQPADVEQAKPAARKAPKTRDGG